MPGRALWKMQHIHNHGGGGGGDVTLQPCYSRENPSTHCTESWLGLGVRLNDMENLAPTDIRSPDRKDAVLLLRYVN
jgi:hypothetical protein